MSKKFVVSLGRRIAVTIEHLPFPAQQRVLPFSATERHEIGIDAKFPSEIRACCPVHEDLESYPSPSVESAASSSRNVYIAGFAYTNWDGWGASECSLSLSASRTKVGRSS